MESIKWKFAHKLVLKIDINYAHDIISHPMHMESFRNQIRIHLWLEKIKLKVGTEFILQYHTQDVILTVKEIEGIDKNNDCYFICFLGTDISFSTNEEKHDKSIISFENIRGYDKPIEILKKTIDRLFNDSSSKSKKFEGILISGSSGCGKSLVGEIIFKKYKNKCFKPDMDEIKSQYKGETEHNLQSLFKEAYAR